MLEKHLCVDLLVCFGLRSYTCCFRFGFYDLLLHAVFSEDIGKHFFLLDFALTKILLLFSFNFKLPLV